MRSPFTKFFIDDGVFMIILATLASFLWLDLRFTQEEVSTMQSERDFLARTLQEMKEDREYLEEKLQDVLIVQVTAYSSTPDQTDDTPFITASGSIVRDGVVASNFLPFRTKIRLPEVFGGKVFTVEDRMKRNDAVDVWFPTREAALEFGVRNLKMEILEN